MSCWYRPCGHTPWYAGIVQAILLGEDGRPCAVVSNEASGVPHVVAVVPERINFGEKKPK